MEADGGGGKNGAELGSGLAEFLGGGAGGGVVGVAAIVFDILGGVVLPGLDRGVLLEGVEPLAEAGAVVGEIKLTMGGDRRPPLQPGINGNIHQTQGIAEDVGLIRCEGFGFEEAAMVVQFLAPLVLLGGVLGEEEFIKGCGEFGVYEVDPNPSDRPLSR